jgi:hypothetical protein
MVVYDERLWRAVATSLQLVGAHAARTGATGLLDVAASFFGEGPALLQGSGIFGVPDRLGRWSIAEFERLTHSFPMDDLAEPSAGLLAATHLVTTDLESIFGHAEARQVTIDGTIRLTAIPTSSRNEVSRWANRWNLPLEDG